MHGVLKRLLCAVSHILRPVASSLLILKGRKSGNSVTAMHCLTQVGMHKIHGEDINMLL